MKYAIDNITTDQLIEKIKEQGLQKDIYSNLFGMQSGYLIFVKMDEQGEVYLCTESQNTGWNYTDYNPDLFTLKCGWDIQEALCEDDDYIAELDEDGDETGKWSIKGYDDSFEYWYEYSEWNLDDLVRDSIEMAYIDHKF